VPKGLFDRVRDRLWGEDITSLADGTIIRSIGAFFGRDFSAVCFRRGGILPYIVPYPYSAVVFGNTVNIRRGLESVLFDPHVMAEELFHVIQWQRMGRIRIAFAYLFYHLTRGYAGNPIERQAKERADAYCASLNARS
jgi:hypothetical protein